MKRWIPWGIVLFCVLGLAAFLRKPVMDAGVFTGVWYYSEDGSSYVFEQGILRNAESCLTFSDGEVFSGAYSFSRDQITLFLIDAAGVCEVKDLHLVRSARGDMLCELEKSSEKVWFYRNRENFSSDK